MAQKYIPMFRLVIFLLLSFCFIEQNYAQPVQQINKTDIDLTKDLVKSYMLYFKDYDPLAPISHRKARFNHIVDQENPNLSKSDRERAFKIVDAYIRADKGLPVDYKISDKDKKSMEELLGDAQQKQADGMKTMKGEVYRIKNMSYSEYKNFVSQNGQIPYKESDIQKSYNKLHQNDGKQVKVTADKPQPMNYIQAIDILRNPKKHSYDEFSKAMRFIKPEISDEDIKKAWEKR